MSNPFGASHQLLSERERFDAQYIPVPESGCWHRMISVRKDLNGRPYQVVDWIAVNGNDHPRSLNCPILCVDRKHIATLPGTITYRFPYARSTRGQIRWKTSVLKTVTAKDFHAR